MSKRKNKHLKKVLGLFLAVPVLVGIAVGIKIASQANAAGQNYDKIKISSAVINSRVTGTVPFSSTSDMNGNDASASDDYVRTFDTVKYDVEVSTVAVDPSETLYGGTIFVKVTVPKYQNGEAALKFGSDVWMEDVKVDNNDKSVVTMKYTIPNNEQASSINRILSFTAVVGGYAQVNSKGPTFEFWMEGNKPDNSSSQNQSVVVSDARQIIITGKQNVNANIHADGDVHAQWIRPDMNDAGVPGIYNHFSVNGSVYSGSTSSYDFRGVEMPYREMTMRYRVSYKYRQNSSGGDFKSFPSTNPLNGAYIVAYGPNVAAAPVFGTYTPITDFFRGIDIWLPFYKGTVDCGDMSVDLTGDILTVKYKNFKALNNKLYSRSDFRLFDGLGFFAVGSIQLFFPLANDGNQNDYEVKYDLIDYSYGKADGTTVTTLAKDDAKTNDNTGGFIKYTNFSDGLLGQQVTVATTQNDSKGWIDGSSIHQMGKDLAGYYMYGLTDGPVYGGVKALLLWDNNYIRFSGVTASDTTGSNNTVSGDKVIFSYGVLKGAESKGITTLEELNTKDFEDFTWYSTYSEALSHGVVTAVTADDPENLGFGSQRDIVPTFKTFCNEADGCVGKQALFRMRSRAYLDAARTQEIKYGGDRYNSSNSFVPSEWAGNNFIGQDSINFGDTITFADSYTKVTITTRDDADVIKRNYSVSERYVKYLVEPKLINGFNENQNDPVKKNVKLTVTLPANLSYVDKSATKAPNSVVKNADGSSTITWIYPEWKVNRTAPGGNIELLAAIDESTPNNTQLTTKAVIGYEGERSNEVQHRTSESGIAISNLAGSSIRTDVNKLVIERDDSFAVSQIIGNNTDNTITNARIVEVLPRNGDDKGNSFFGSYTITPTSIPSGQKMYYTTAAIADSGLTKDGTGAYVATGVNLSDSKWVQVSAGATIPATATAIIRTIDSISPRTSLSYSYTVKTSGNNANNIYAFRSSLTGQPLATALMSNVVKTKVINRKLGGIAFIDSNKNDKYDDSDARLANILLELVDADGKRVATTSTDDNGVYTFTNLRRANYAVRAALTDEQSKLYSIISKQNIDANAFNNNFDPESKITNVIAFLNADIDDASGEKAITTIGVGLVANPATLIVKHIYILKDGSEKVIDDKTETYDNKYVIGDKYTTNSLAEKDLVNGYKLREKPSNSEGTINDAVVEVKYYYVDQYGSPKTAAGIITPILFTVTPMVAIAILIGMRSPKTKKK
ncbi:MAG: hypothetical protein MJ154_02570 [Candidatus Saccharibacteria bacterium]|nr:hypothetical protein [Candidatus Saccharibacteria bacterium]